MLNDEISKRIRQLRMNQGITQEVLANKAGIDLSHLGKIERGQKTNMSLELLDKIIGALEVEYDEFFLFENTDSEFKKIQYDISISDNKDEVLELIKGIVRLDKK